MAIPYIGSKISVRVVAVLALANFVKFVLIIVMILLQSEFVWKGLPIYRQTWL